MYIRTSIIDSWELFFEINFVLLLRLMNILIVYSHMQEGKKPCKKMFRSHDHDPLSCKALSSKFLRNYTKNRWSGRVSFCRSITGTQALAILGFIRLWEGKTIYDYHLLMKICLTPNLCVKRRSVDVVPHVEEGICFSCLKRELHIRVICLIYPFGTKPSCYWASELKIAWNTRECFLLLVIYSECEYTWSISMDLKTCIRGFSI